MVYLIICCLLGFLIILKFIHYTFYKKNLESFNNKKDYFYDKTNFYVIKDSLIQQDTLNDYIKQLNK